MFLGELLQALLPSKGRFESLDSAIEIVTCFVEDLFSRKNLQYSILTLEDFFGEEEC